jgi:hypothetical protein
MPDVTITPSEDGPYLVSGPVLLTDVDGREIPHLDPMSPLPLRPVREQAVLRRHPPHHRL